MVTADQRLSDVTSLSMCTAVCPCVWDGADSDNPWLQLTFDELAVYERTKNLGSAQDSDTGYYNLVFQTSGASDT